MIVPNLRGESNFKSAAKVTIAGALVLVAMAGTLAAAQRDQRKLPGSDIIPVDRLADWRPGVTVGVPGGIPADRTRLIDVTKAPYNADNTGAADAQPAIQQAIKAAKEKDVVYLPAGTYRLDKQVALGFKRGITIRGAGPDKTVVLTYGKAAAFTVGGGADYQWKRELSITGSPKKGDTVLTVGDTAPLDKSPNGGVGMICRIVLRKNDPNLPVIAPAHWEGARKAMSRVVARAAGTVTISPPLLYDLPESLEPKIAVATGQAEFDGIEDLKIDGANSKGAWLINMEQCYGCWFKNVTCLRCLGYHVSLFDDFQCEVRHCCVAKRLREGSNGAGVIVWCVSSSLFEDNIVAEQFPHFEVNASCGNVIAYNFCHDSSVMGLLGCSINSDHSPHCSFNLYEGNVAQKFQCDGYHGSASHDTVFRNWFHGTSDKTDQFWICVDLNRFTRDYSLVGNILGAKGYDWLLDNGNKGFGYKKHFIYVLGMPNIGNGGFNGKTVQPSKGINWPDWDKMMSSEKGKGPGPDGFQELDLDVAATTLLKGNYNYKDNAVPQSESLKGASLPKSLYLDKKSAWFGDLAWPAFGPDVAFERNKIPAQARFEQMTKEGGGS
jgi:hypothetical protein